VTRINLVPPEELSDQHLIAEYREIFMVGSSLQRSLKSPNWEKTKRSIPKQFTLNKGHVKFFYDKGKYLSKRYDELIKEMRRRDMNPDPYRIFKKGQWPDELYKNWRPNHIDLKIVRKRIKTKIDLKPDWYKWNGKNLTTI
tara:strand:- start:139 stop:561 length:423 start_codon:yes stop_codon:yes gene_type:complete